MEGLFPAHDQGGGLNKEDMAADDLVRIFERENPHNAPVQRPARSTRIRATRWTLDSPDIAFPGSSEEPHTTHHEDMDILAALGRNKKTHWAQILGPKERTRINGLSYWLGQHSPLRGNREGPTKVTAWRFF